MKNKQERKRQLILEFLREVSVPQKSLEISESLSASGSDISARTARLYLAELVADGFVERLGRSGYALTQKGMSELNAATAISRVGFLSAQIDRMTCRMSFDLVNRAGTVLVNTSLVKVADLKQCSDQIMEVFEKGYAMGDFMAVLPEGETVGDIFIPEGYVGFCSVCSITMNGVLLKHGIPMRSRFGGLLEVTGSKTRRFVEMIMYNGTSIDPLEVFIRSGMTNYVGAITSGNGCIGASFREFPADCRERVVAIAEKLDRVGLGAFMKIGRSGQTIMGISVDAGLCGAVVVGGLNPISILEENGHRVESRALSGLLEYDRLFHYSELKERLSS